MNKVGETFRPLRYDLNLIPSDCAVAVTNRFKGLDLIHRVRDGGSRHCTGDSDQDQRQEKEMQKGKMLVLGGLTNS